MARARQFPTDTRKKADTPISNLTVGMSGRRHYVGQTDRLDDLKYPN